MCGGQRVRGQPAGVGFLLPCSYPAGLPEPPPTEPPCRSQSIWFRGYYCLKKKARGKCQGDQLCLYLSCSPLRSGSQPYLELTFELQMFEVQLETHSLFMSKRQEQVRLRPTLWRHQYLAPQGRNTENRKPSPCACSALNTLSHQPQDKPYRGRLPLRFSVLIRQRRHE